MWTLTSPSCWTNTSKSHLDFLLHEKDGKICWVGFLLFAAKSIHSDTACTPVRLSDRLLFPLSGLLTLLSSLFLLLFPPLPYVVPILPLLILYLELESLFLWNNYFLSHRAVLHCGNILKILFSPKWGLFPKKPQVVLGGGRGLFFTTSEWMSCLSKAHVSTRMHQNWTDLWLTSICFPGDSDLPAIWEIQVWSLHLEDPLEKVKLLSRVWLCDPMDCCLPGSTIHGIFQARILE